MARRVTVAVSAGLLLAGMLLTATDTEEVTLGRVGVIVVLCLGGLAAFGLTFKQK